MRVRAFTGPSRLDEGQSAWVSGAVAKLGWADEIRSGAARGADTIAAQVSMDRHPRAHHVLYVPDAPHNVSLTRYMSRRGADVVICPNRPTRSGAYRARNEQMVEGATELVAFLTSATFYRSGEWMTINIARQKGVRVIGLLIESTSVGSTPVAHTEE